MHLIGAGFRLHQHDGTKAAAELRCEVVRQNLHFLDRADIDRLTVLVLRSVVIRYAVINVVPRVPVPLNETELPLDRV